MDEQPLAPDYDSQTPRPRRRRSWWSIRLTPAGLFILLLLNLIACVFAAWPLWSFRQETARETAAAQLQTQPLQTTQPAPATASPSPTAPDRPVRTPTRFVTTPAPGSSPLAPSLAFADGLLVLALQDGLNSHLFAYQPWQGAGDGLPLTRLTYGPWDDVQPALSPDGKRLVFASNRNGYWDLYLLELASGLVSRVTDTLEYDGMPAWSPDGLWLVYETYLDGSLEVVVRAADDPQEPIRLTIHPGADYAPVWSPQGRQVAFVSDRSGEPEIWLVNLDQVDEKLMLNVSRQPLAPEDAPAWSPDGRYLAWASQQDGFWTLYVWDSSAPEQEPQRVGTGDLPIWSPDGRTLLAGLYTPNQHYLVAYSLQQNGVMLPAVRLPGWLEGLSWGPAALTFPLKDPYRQAAVATLAPVWLPDAKPNPDIPGGRQQLIRQDDLQAPSPFLQDQVDESFIALRQRLAQVIGWDYLGTLENAYVPLTSPLDPGMGKSWLYTGRAFAANTLPLNAGWLVVVREDFGLETYWRVYLRTRFQDGSAGKPLRRLPWDFNARFGGGAAVYEQGGQRMTALPDGYWYDLTRLVGVYGWERLPALSLWRASYPAARFNEFTLDFGMDWQQAMLEIYPPEALVTPTPLLPPTRTPTLTPRWYQSPTPTATLTPRPTLTPLTPSPSPTPSITQTAPPSDTFTPTATQKPSATPTPGPTTTATRAAPSATP